MRHDWTAFPDGPNGNAYLLSVTTLETGEPVTNASAEELAAEILRLKEQNGFLRQGQSGDLLDLGADDPRLANILEAFDRIVPGEG